MRTVGGLVVLEQAGAAAHGRRRSARGQSAAGHRHCAVTRAGRRRRKLAGLRHALRAQRRPWSGSGCRQQMAVPLHHAQVEHLVFLAHVGSARSGIRGAVVNADALYLLRGGRNGRAVPACGDARAAEETRRPDGEATPVAPALAGARRPGRDSDQRHQGLEGLDDAVPAGRAAADVDGGEGRRLPHRRVRRHAAAASAVGSTSLFMRGRTPQRVGRTTHAPDTERSPRLGGGSSAEGKLLV